MTGVPPGAVAQLGAQRRARPPRQGGGAALHLRLHRQRRDAVDPAQDLSRAHHLFRRAEPCEHDRGGAAERRRQADLSPQ